MLKIILTGIMMLGIMGVIWNAENFKRTRSGFYLLGFAVALLLIVLSMAAAVEARDLGQWADQDPAVRQWYQALMQPDNPKGSCCGEADAYWCDEVHVREGKTFCGITDDRPDEPRGRPHLAIGTQLEIPPEKLKFDKANPTGHFIVFVSRNGLVYCFVQGWQG